MEGSWIEEARRSIDVIDQEILGLLEARMKLCRKIGEAKKERGYPITDPEREKEVLDRAGPYSRVFKEIIALCKEAQETLNATSGGRT